MAVKPRALGRIDGNSNYATYDFVVTSGVTVTEGDFVYFDGSGAITNSSVAGQQLVGMAEETVTGDGTEKCRVIVDPTMRYLVDNDNVSTTFAATHVGTSFDLTGATGAQLVDTDTTDANSGQLRCLEYNPQIDPVKDDTSFGIFVIQEHFLYPEGTGA